MSNVKASINPHPLRGAAQANDHLPLCVWFTGLSGSGKTTLARAIEQRLVRLGARTRVLDGDDLRVGLNRDLGFSAQDRKENVRRLGEVAKLFHDSGFIVLVSAISPFTEDRRAARALFAPGRFVEVHVATPLSVCESRDPKGLYQRARRGELPGFTGIDSAYEQPQDCECVVHGERCTVDEGARQVLDIVERCCGLAHVGEREGA